jgi:Domain of unknown function (DUF4388)
MSRSVLLVEPDVDALGALASELRSRGLNVSLADDADGAIARARATRLDAVLVSAPLMRELSGRLSQERELAELPRFALVDGPAADSAEGESLPRGEPDLIARRLYSLPLKSAPVVADRGDFRGDLKQVSAVDLLQLLSMNRRTGVLSVTTASGAGEVRLANGEVVDAVYRRLEAEKALYRMLGETEGSFAFASGSASPLRRVQTATSMLLMEGMRRVDEVRRRRAELVAEDDALLAIGAPDHKATDVLRRVSELLSVPRTLDEILDELPDGDLELLEATNELLQSGVVRRIAKGAERAELADAEQMTVLGAVVKRLKRPGFAGPTRLVVAASPRRLGTLMHSVQRIADASLPPESPPAAPVPHVLATLRLSEGEELEIIGLPSLDAYGPIWSLTLPGSAAVIRLDAASTHPFDEVCAVAGVALIDAGALGPVDETDPGQMAALIRTALDRAAAR